jgi:DNA-3-methyladenine glycosylase I
MDNGAKNNFRKQTDKGNNTKATNVDNNTARKLDMSNCRAWAEGDDLMMDYHDKRWCVPVHDDNELFAMLCLEGQQAGLSWSTIIHKEASYRMAFSNFDIEAVARYTDQQLEALMSNSQLVRNRLKIGSVIKNANAIIRIKKSGEYSSFDEYIWHFTDGKRIVHHYNRLDQVPSQNDLSVKVSRDLKKRGFSFVGPVIIYSYLQGIGVIDDHLDNCPYKKMILNNN